MSKKAGICTVGFVLALGLAGWGTWHALKPTQQLEPIAASPSASLEQQFNSQVRPFVEEHCLSCHSGAKPEAGLDLSPEKDVAVVAVHLGKWDRIAERLRAGE